MVIASSLVNKVAEECNFKDFKVLKEFAGEEFKNTICKHPFENIGYKYDVPMLEGNFVTLDQGTGIVHAAPSHGPDDFNLCLKNGIKATNTIDDGGLYSLDTGFMEVGGFLEGKIWTNFTKTQVLTDHINGIVAEFEYKYESKEKKGMMIHCQIH